MRASTAPISMGRPCRSPGPVSGRTGVNRPSRAPARPRECSRAPSAAPPPRAGITRCRSAARTPAAGPLASRAPATGATDGGVARAQASPRTRAVVQQAVVVHQLHVAGLQVHQEVQARVVAERVEQVSASPLRASRRGASGKTLCRFDVLVDGGQRPCAPADPPVHHRNLEIRGLPWGHLAAPVGGDRSEHRRGQVGRRRHLVEQRHRDTRAERPPRAVCWHSRPTMSQESVVVGLAFVGLVDTHVPGRPSAGPGRAWPSRWPAAFCGRAGPRQAPSSMKATPSCARPQACTGSRGPARSPRSSSRRMPVHPGRHRRQPGAQACGSAPASAAPSGSRRSPPAGVRPQGLAGRYRQSVRAAMARPNQAQAGLDAGAGRWVRPSGHAASSAAAQGRQVEGVEHVQHALGGGRRCAPRRGPARRPGGACRPGWRPRSPARGAAPGQRPVRQWAPRPDGAGAVRPAGRRRTARPGARPAMPARSGASSTRSPCTNTAGGCASTSAARKRGRRKRDRLSVPPGPVRASAPVADVDEGVLLRQRGSTAASRARSAAPASARTARRARRPVTSQAASPGPSAVVARMGGPPGAHGVTNQPATGVGAFGRWQREELRLSRRKPAAQAVVDLTHVVLGDAVELRVKWLRPMRRAGDRLRHSSPRSGRRFMPRTVWSHRELDRVAVVGHFLAHRLPAGQRRPVGAPGARPSATGCGPGR